MVNPDETNQEAELEWQQLSSADNITYYGADRNDEWWNEIIDPDEYPDE